MKILFAHGLASSGKYKMADSLRILLRPVHVISPDLPLDPDAAVKMLRDICNQERPDLVVGLSLGGFMAQKLRGERRLLVNPDFHPSRLLCTMVGENKYLSPRADGALTFTVTEEVCRSYELMEQTQFEGIDSSEAKSVTGMFADADEMVHCGEEFAQHYPGRFFSYPGGHLPDYPQLKAYIVPVLRTLVPSI